MKRSGIYHIQIGPWFYYGQSIDLERRRYQHLYTLKADLHCNPILQRAYNKYQQFEFSVVGEVAPSELDGAEQFFIDCFHGTEYCANIAKDVLAPNRDRKRSEETKAKISASRKNNNSKSWGREPIPVEIDGVLYPSIKEAARQFKTHPRVIRDMMENPQIRDDEWFYSYGVVNHNNYDSFSEAQDTVLAILQDMIDNGTPRQKALASMYSSINNLDKKEVAEVFGCTVRNIERLKSKLVQHIKERYLELNA